MSETSHTVAEQAAPLPTETTQYTIRDLVADQGLPLDPGSSDDDTPLYCLAYLSTSAALLGLENDMTLVRLLEACRAANIERRITGLLLYIFTGTAGHFIQVLEGKQEHVRATFARIVLDRRHRDIITLWEGPIEKRQFGSWLMSFKPLDEEAMRQWSLDGVADNGFQSFHELRHSLLLAMEGGDSEAIQIIRKIAAGMEPAILG